MGYDIEKEKREAIEAGQRALSSLRTAKENLNSAKNWGLVDMFGGGFFSTMLKHSKMDQARQNMEQAKYDLRNFSRELMDLLWIGWCRIESIMPDIRWKKLSAERNTS